MYFILLNTQDHHFHAKHIIVKALLEISQRINLFGVETVQKAKKVVWITQSDKGVVIPTRRICIGVVSPLNSDGRTNLVKVGFLKFFHSIIERIAEL